MTHQKLAELIAAIQSIRAAADDTVALAAKELYPAWKTNTSYSAGDRVLFADALYKCLQGHTSQDTWTPTAAVSLWAKVLIPEPEVIPEWVQPDSTNPYMAGDKVTHNGKTWESIVDSNVWEPGVYGWTEV